jgi:hypothetical protein
MSIYWKKKNGGVFEGNIPYFSITLDDKEMDIEFYGLNHGQGVFENKAWIKPEDFALILRKLNIVNEDFIEEMLYNTEYWDLYAWAKSIVDARGSLGRRRLPLIIMSGQEDLKSDASEYEKVENRLEKTIELMDRFEPYLEECETICEACEYLLKESELAKEYLKKKTDTNGNKRKTGEAGHVYLIMSENGFYKIGRTKNINSRFKMFKTIFPMKWEFVHSFESNDYVNAESKLHNMFYEKRKMGEWFELSPKDVSYISSIGDFDL